jgi:hypothetical protein
MEPQPRQFPLSPRVFELFPCVGQLARHLFLRSTHKLSEQWHRHARNVPRAPVSGVNVSLSVPSTVLKRYDRTDRLRPHLDRAIKASRSTDDGFPYLQV